MAFMTPTPPSPAPPVAPVRTATPNIFDRAKAAVADRIASLETRASVAETLVADRDSKILALNTEIAQARTETVILPATATQNPAEATTVAAPVSSKNAAPTTAPNITAESRLETLRAQFKTESDPTKRAHLAGDIAALSRSAAVINPTNPQVAASSASTRNRLEALRAQFKSEADPVGRGNLAREIATLSRKSPVA